MEEKVKSAELERDGAQPGNLPEKTDHPDLEVIRNICDLRAQFRNKFRVPILETTNLLKRRVPDVDADTVMREERDRLHYRAKRNLRSGSYKNVRQAYDEALEYRAAKKGTVSLHNEELGKYEASKLIMEWRKSGSAAVLESMRASRLRTYTNAEAGQSVAEEVDFMIREEAVRMMKSGDFKKAVEGMMKFKGFVSCSRDELRDMGMDDKDEEGLMDALADLCADWLGKNPRIYQAVKDRFCTDGFKEAGKLHERKIMREAARKMVGEAATLGVCYLEEALNELDEMGLLDKEEARKWPEVVSRLEGRLVVAMRQSPSAYLRMREYLAEAAIMKEEEADALEKVKDAFDDFIVAVNRINPELGMLFIIQLCDKGFIPGKVCEQELVKIEEGLLSGELHYPPKDEKMVRRAAQENAAAANEFLEADKHNELMVFRSMRYAFCLDLANFITAYPQFQKVFPDFRPGEYLGDGD